MESTFISIKPSMPDHIPAHPQVEEGNSLLNYKDYYVRIHERVKQSLAEISEQFDSISEFMQGYNYYGCNKVADKIVFREWLPEAEKVFAFGAFNGWDQESVPMSMVKPDIWEATVPADSCPDGSQYRLKVVCKNGHLLYINQAYARYAIQMPDQYRQFNSVYFESTY